jgi:GAF domain-containing protein/anti-sigma regulatory factor (Ser/Thr protein kinase)
MMSADEKIFSLYEVACRVGASLDLQTTLKAVVDAAADFIPCALAEVSLWDEPSQMLVLQALHADAHRSYPIGRAFPPGEGYTGWIVRNHKSLLVPDVDAFQDIRPHILPGEKPFKAYAGVPLMLDESFVGTLVLVADQSGAFTPSDMQLLQTLAHPAATAIRNAQRYEQTRRQARKLSAVNTVASVISQTLPISEIIKRAVDKVVEVMETDGGGIRLLDDETGELVLSASKGLSPAFIQKVNRIKVGEGIVGQVAKTGIPMVVEDIEHDPRTMSKPIAVEGFHTFAAVPISAKKKVIGTLGTATRSAREYTPEDLELMMAIGHQIGVAVENARLYNDLSKRAKELEALYAVAEVVNQPGELNQILAEGLSQTLAVTELDMGAIALIDPEDGSLSFSAYKGLSEGFINWMKDMVRAKIIDPEAWPTEKYFHVEDLLLVHPVLPQEVLDEGLRLYAEIPFFADGSLVGVLIVATRGEHEFTVEEIVLLQAVGHQLGTAIADARLRQEALEAERLVAIGQVAASVAHDLRSPLGGILRSAELMTRPELSPDTRQKLSHSIASLARRLINTSQQILEYVQQEQLSLARTPHKLSAYLNQVLDDLEVDFSDRGIEVLKKFQYSGEIWIDGNRMAQVIYNIAANARDVMPDGGKFTVSTHLLRNQVEICFSDTGPGVPQELGQKIFEPFFTYGKRQGTGLGLAIARRIVEEHGGTINYEKFNKAGATFIVLLPV